MRRIILLLLSLLWLSSFGAAGGLSPEREAGLAALMESLAEPECDASGIMAEIEAEFGADSEEPLVRAVLALACLRRGIDASGAERAEMLGKACELFEACAGENREEIDGRLRIEWARALMLRADGFTDPGKAEMVAELCGRAFAVLNASPPGEERDLLLAELCRKTGQMAMARRYERAAAVRAGSVAELERRLDGEIALRGWRIEDNSADGVSSFQLTDETPGAGFVANFYRLTERRFRDPGKFPDLLAGFAAPVLSKSREGALQNREYEYVRGPLRVVGVYATVTDREWRPGDEASGSRQFVTMALFRDSRGGEGASVYGVIFSDFAAAEKLWEILDFVSGREFASGRF